MRNPSARLQKPAKRKPANATLDNKNARKQPTGKTLGSIEDEALKFIAELVESITPEDCREPNTFTTAEFAVHSGIERSRALRLLKLLVPGKQIQPVMVKRRNMWGAIKQLPGFKVL